MRRSFTAVATLTLTLAVLGCGDVDPELGAQRAPLLGDINYGGTCTPALRSFQEKLTRFGRTAAVTRAFRECLSQAMTGTVNLTYGGTTGPYRKCTGDPWYSSTLQTQLDKIVDMSLSLNDLHVNCSGGMGNASVAGADQHDYDYGGDETFSWSHWFADVQAEIGLPVCTNPATVSPCRYLPYPWPYDQGAGITWHEVSHTHGYTHGANDQTAAKTACGYAGDATWHFQRNTMPYIVGDCMEEVLARSGVRCGGHVEDDLECVAGSLRLIDGFESTTCSCVQDPKAAAALFKVEVRDASDDLVNRTLCGPATLSARVLPLTGTCAHATISLFHGGVSLVSAVVTPYTWHSFNVGAFSGAIDVRATCGGETHSQRVNLDHTAPTFTAVSVGGAWSSDPVRVSLSGVSDDGWWLSSEYTTAIHLDGVYQGRFNGVGATLSGVAAGAHTLRATLQDGCGRRSTSRDVSFNVDRTAPTIAFSSPAASALVLRTSALSVSVVGGDPSGYPIDATRVSGVASARLYLDGLPAELGGGAALCTFSGPWITGFATTVSCTVPAFTLPVGTHQLLAVITDRAGNQATAQRSIVVH